MSGSLRRSDQSTYDIQINLISSALDGVELTTGEACEAEGGSPILRSFFYANADQDPDLEIGVICGWKQPSAADCPHYDQARFFKVVKKSDAKFQLQRVESAKVKSLIHNEKSSVTKGEICEGAPNFTNAADVKRLLGSAKR